jgi:hypothetical protein
MANSFSPISSAAVKVIARLAAKKALTEQLRQQGVRQPLVRRSSVSAHQAEHPASKRWRQPGSFRSEVSRRGSMPCCSMMIGGFGGSPAHL